MGKAGSCLIDDNPSSAENMSGDVAKAPGPIEAILQDPNSADELEETHQNLLAEWTANRDAAMSRFVLKDNDEITGSQTFKPSNAPKYMNSRTTIYGAFERDSKTSPPNPYVVFNYAGQDWVFFNKLVVKADDQVFEIPISGTNTDHAGGKVGEIKTVGVENYATQLYLLANSKKSMVRFEGKRRHDHTMRKWEKQSLKDVMTLTLKKPTRKDAAKAIHLARQVEKAKASGQQP